MGNAFSTTPITGEASGIYSAQDDVEEIYGDVNVAIWSSLDGENAVPNVDRIQSALNATDSYVNWLATLYGYATPIPNTIANWSRLSRLAAEDAGVELYIARGLPDEDQKGWGGKMARRRTELRGDPKTGSRGEIENFFRIGVVGATRLGITFVEDDGPAGYTACGGAVSPCPPDFGQSWCGRARWC